jgi:large subunit ribosomal protein L29
MKTSELRAKSATELTAELVSLRKEQFALRLQRATGQAPKPDQFGKVRKSIARLKTVQRELRGKSGGK